ncbi:hypothetical protein [Nodularia sphaerocarpa]|nr:hypothetical protein [Nodularia sphaerocarpa]
MQSSNDNAGRLLQALNISKLTEPIASNPVNSGELAEPIFNFML